MSKNQTKYIFVFGGVLSGLGKGIVASSLGYLLKSLNLNITIQKLDPYLNVDPGTMNPFQHGEVFVLDDGSETDLDLGHYERFIDVDLSRENTTSSGRVYWDVLKRERKGDYLGETIQVIPHITDEIKRRIIKVNKRKKFDVVITEVGGTVGDIEGQPFYEAIRQLILEQGKENCLVIHTTLLPFINAAGEVKTKPTQHSVMRLREIGLEPDMLVCRTEDDNHLNSKIKKKLGLFCNVLPEHVFESPDVETIYEIPIVLYKQKFDSAIINTLKIKLKQNHQNILEIRQVIQSYVDVGKIYLGGIPMIADDMMTFIKNDIIVFGLGVFLFIVATLWYVFRRLIWIIVPISSCFFFSYNNDRTSRYLRLESYRYIIKFYSFNVNINNGYEYSY